MIRNPVKDEVVAEKDKHKMEKKGVHSLLKPKLLSVKVKWIERFERVNANLNI